MKVTRESKNIFYIESEFSGVGFFWVDENLRVNKELTLKVTVENEMDVRVADVILGQWKLAGFPNGSF